MSKVERAFSVVFGLFLLGVGAYAIGFGSAPLIWRIAGGALLAVLGGNMVYAGWRARRSWLSRVGPLP